MPVFYTENNCDDRLIISTDDFLSECNEQQIQEIVDIFIEDGTISIDGLLEISKRHNIDGTFQSNLNLLSKKWVSLSIDDENIINNIANKYR